MNNFKERLTLTFYLGLIAVGLIPIASASEHDNDPYPIQVIEGQVEKFYRPHLERYLEIIQPEYDKYYEVITQQRFFDVFKGLTLEQQIEDFEIYFPLYYAAEIKYGIPWEMLWVAHEQETVASRHEFPTEGFQMGMQRNDEYYTFKDVLEASRGFEYLQLWEGQRYHPGLGPGHTYDYQEILWAASKMRENAMMNMEANPGMKWDQAVKSAQYSYCAPFCAAERNEEYERLVYRLENALEPERRNFANVPQPVLE